MTRAIPRGTPAEVQLPFELSVALRYMRSGRTAGISLPTLLTILGVVIGVAALTVVTSLWNGFEAAFLDKLLGVNAHAIVLKRYNVFRDHEEVAQKLLEDPAIERVTPFVYSEVIVQSPRGVQGVAIKGIDPQRAKETPLSRYLEAPAFDRLRTRSATSARDLPGIAIGAELQESLHVKIGDGITIISPYGANGDAQTADFRVIGIFESGMHQFDARMVFIHLEEAQSFFRLHTSVTGLEVWTNDPISSNQTVDDAAKMITGHGIFEVKDWSRSSEGVFGAVRVQKAMISIVLFIIVVVAAFNIMATLILLILQKKREIAILKSLGATNRSIITIFVIDGTMVGFIGCAMGLAVGLALCAVLEKYGLKLDPRVYYMSALPIVVRPIELVAVSVGTMLLSIAATVFPALRAGGMRPVDGLNRRGRVGFRSAKGA